MNNFGNRIREQRGHHKAARITRLALIVNTPAACRTLLVASNDDDIESNKTLDKPTKGRLKKNRERLRRLLTDEHVERLRQVKLIDDVLACTERVLNPAAHSGSPPLYQKEIDDALKLIKQLESSLK